MKVIYKYKLKDAQGQSVEMMNGAKILSVQRQHGVTCIWALVDPMRGKITRRVYRVGTGHDLDGLENPESYEYIGTVVEDLYVWHYYIWI